MWTRIRRLLKKWGMSLSSKGPGFWGFVASVPVLRRFFNRLFINLITNSTKPRPHPLSLWGPDATASTPSGAASADYVSWTGLVDRTYTGRHLPPADQSYLDALPALDKLRPLFQRQQQLTPCPKSTALFGFFAQWFTDSFLRTDPIDFRKTTSNHEIDLCQIYGLDAGDTAILRSHSGGLLRSETIDGSEYPARLFGEDGLVKTEFLDLKYVDKSTRDLNPAIFTTQHFANMPDRKPDLFVSGLERGNSTIFYSAISTIFLREHNRLCREMAKRHPDWDDDRLFETARNTNIVELLQIIIGDYINHLSTALFHVYVDPGVADTQRWYRTNRIAAEFDLLYRWHPLAPTDFTLDTSLPNEEFRYNNALLFKYGIEKIFDEGSKQHAGRIMLHNTPWFLVDFEIAALQKSRYWRLQSYNAYRECFDLDPMSSFEELTGDKALAAELEALYGKVDNVEFTVGLLAEQRPANAPIGETMMYMVGGDAFSQALTNPLLANGIYCEDCFSDVGVEAIKSTSTFADIVRRNTQSTGGKVSFDIRPQNTVTPTMNTGGVPSAAPIPVPGSYGLPVLGRVLDTLDFLFVSGWTEFFARRQRKYRSNVFKVNLFRPTIVLLDHPAISRLFKSEHLVQDYGFSWAIPPRPMVGDVSPSIFESGDDHDVPKMFYMRLLQKRSSTLVAVFNEVAEEFITRWAWLGEFEWRDELEDFAMSFLFQWMLGERPDTKDVRFLYNNIFLHVFPAITKHIPWSKYCRSVVIYERLLAFVKRSKNFPEIAALAGEAGLTDQEYVAKQITFLLGMNSFLGVQCFMKGIVGELGSRAELCDRLRAEMKAALGPSQTLTDIKALAAMPTLDKTLREILRLHPPVSFIFGRATCDLVIESKTGAFRVAAGELVMGVIPFAHQDASSFAQPDRFDPGRFDDPAASAHLIWPRGLHDADVSPQDRTCPGKDIAIVIAKLFAVTLLLKVDWKLDAKPEWDQHKFSLNVAAPKGPIAVTGFRRR